MGTIGASRDVPGPARARHLGGMAIGALVPLVAMLSTALPAWAGTGTTDHDGRSRPPGTTTTTSPASPATSSPMPLPSSPPAVPADTCAKGAWAPSVDGMPSAYGAAGEAAYLWYDADGGWALRVTDANDKPRVVFSGYLTSTSGQFIDVTTVGAGANDIVYEPNGRTVYFRFVNFGQLDGLNFGTECAKAFSVNIHVGPPLAPMSPTSIYLGSGSANPPSDPFRVDRGRLQGGSGTL